MVLPEPERLGRLDTQTEAHADVASIERAQDGPGSSKPSRPVRPVSRSRAAWSGPTQMETAPTYAFIALLARPEAMLFVCRRHGERQ